MMSQLTLIILLVLISCASVRTEHSTPEVQNSKSHAILSDVLWIQNGCTLFSSRKEVHSFPGNFCIFLPDGSFISGNDNALRRFSPSKEVLWEFPGHFHHQLNLTFESNKIVGLVSEVRKNRKEIIRDDIIFIANLEGKVLHRISSEEILRQTNLPGLFWKSTIKIPEADRESSHFNSIYEIPPNKLYPKLSWLKPGNFIANSSGLGIFILSPDLQKVIHHFSYPFSFSNHIHDVQVTHTGELLLFNNLVKNSENARYSAIQKYDPMLKKISFEYTADPKGMFYSPACGGVQELDGHIFFSHITNGGFLYSTEKDQLISTFPGKNANPLDVTPTQQLKIVDVIEFLKRTE